MFTATYRVVRRVHYKIGNHRKLVKDGFSSVAEARKFIESQEQPNILSPEKILLK